MRTNLALFLLVLGATRAASAAMTIQDARCEYAVNPVGIDTLHPRFSWTLDDDTRGQIQTAYQIRVALSPEALEKGDPLLWDTDKTVSDSTTHIAYEGQPLRSGTRYYWRVRAWDRHGKVTAWSEPAFWQTALLNKADWSAKWIGPAEPGTPQWGDITLTAEVTLQEEAFGLVFRAQDSDNLYMWQFNTVIAPGDLLLRPHVCKNGQWSTLPAVSLRNAVPEADTSKPHRIEVEARGATIRTRVDGQLVDERVDTTFASGTVGLRADSKERALVNAVSVVDADGNTLLREAFDAAATAFPNAKTDKGQLVLNGSTLLHRTPLSKACPRLRKTFTLDKPVRLATASVCGLGFYELYLNGAKADCRVLAPANTPYAQRLLFDTIDVTPLVKQGPNAAGLWLAAGYSDDYSQWGWKWEAAKRAILQLDVLFEDNTSARIITDEGWRSGPSPLTFASLYDGETFDASQETPGWSTAAFADGDWKPVTVLAATQANFWPNTMPPVRVTQTIRPARVTEPKPGTFVFDMGQNFAGWVRVRATGPKGTCIVMRHSELLGGDGLLDPWTNRRAKATDTFILRGEGQETYEPRFTYHGFRFVELTGFPGTPTLDDITGCVVHADVQTAGHFVTSDATLNQIHSNCVWSMRSNFMSIPTDCCMRDERTPCQMDSLAYEDAALCNFRMNRYYAKWLDDIRGGRGNPDWNGDMVFLPWRLYRQDGDTRILEAHYDNMRGYLDALHVRKPGHLYDEGFGDWCPPNNGSWEGYHGDVTEVNTSLYAALARIVGLTAELLGKAEEAKRYTSLADEIAKAFHAKRFNASSGEYGDGSQTTAILPLALDITPPDARQTVLEALLKTIRENNKGRLNTGIFGTRYLADVLCDSGNEDLAIDMLTQPEYPGFGHQIAQGATTLWEQWTFKGGMNSHNHAMFAGVDASFYTRLAGITARKAGFSEIGIRPVMPSRLTFVDAAMETVKGRVAVFWRREGKDLLVQMTLPVNTTARIALPAEGSHSVTEGGKRADRVSGITFIGREDGRAVFEAGSGTYSFRIAAATP